MTGRLRIVAGDLGGRLIVCPNSLARPTTDRVREAMFSSIESHLGGLEDVTVCDGFAGSGALGFEALSRGARAVQFFDEDPVALGCLKENAKALNAGCAVDVVRRDVLARGLGGAFAPYGLVLLDPPYATQAEDVGTLIATSVEQGLLVPHCLVVYERASTAPMLPSLPCMVEVRQKRYGKTSVDMLAFDPDGDLEGLH